MIRECLLCFPPPRLSLVLTFIAAAVILAAAVFLINPAHAQDITGKAVNPTTGSCPSVTFQVGPPGAQFPQTYSNGFGLGDWAAGTPRQTVICLQTQEEFDAYNGLVTDNGRITLTTATDNIVIERRGTGTNNRNVVARYPINLGTTTTVTMVSVTVSVSVRTETSVSVSVRTETRVSVSSVTVRVASDGTPIGTVVQTREKVDNKRALQYAAGGVAAFVLIHNWIITDPAKALPFHLAFNEKGGIYSGTSWRLTPQETIHFSALESLDDKRGHYKFGVQWHYQFAPPQGITETPAAALPAIYTMPNVTPKDWLKE